MTSRPSKLRFVAPWVAALAVCGCANKDATAPTDDRLGTIDEAVKSTWAHEDKATTGIDGAIEDLKAARSKLP